MVTETDDCPAATDNGDTLIRVAGGGANSLAIWMPHELAALQYSWIAHRVILSVGSIDTVE